VAVDRSARAAPWAPRSGALSNRAFDTPHPVRDTARMPNRLASATSPYLLQHANNPVDWYEWGPEALDRAGREDKPIFLSIGYAACHWCHVMERESFEDAETAAFMNDHFVCIKVDREERPDLDQIYMSAVQAMTGHGGWPMTMFLTPGGAPFYGGTYFPPEDRHGLPALRRVLMGVAEAWRSQPDEARTQSINLLGHVTRMAGNLPAGGAPDANVLRAAFDAMKAGFDEQWGGFGGAPKFPQPMTLEFLLRATRLGFDGSREMLSLTLTRMARGGIFDQVGGGFHRYSVDGFWLVPHFEKMLYDNGQMLRLYARAAVGLDDPLDLYRETAIATGEYLLREMRHDDGGFFSSGDADSEGVEGKFFVWDADDVMRVAGDDAEIVAAAWSLQPGGNFEGSSILWIPAPLTQVAEVTGATPERIRAAIARVRARLFDLREQRVRPATDDKVLASWNGLAISGLAEAGRLLGRDDFVAAAVRAADFVLSNLRRDDGRLLRSWRDGRVSGPGYLDDYALLAGALLDLYETTFDARFYREARTVADQMLELFADPAGGFFDTGSDAESLVLRPRDVFDNAVPSGNSAAATLLLRLAALTGQAGYEDRALEALRRVTGIAGQAPLGFGEALCAIDAATAGIKEIAIAGTGGDARALADVAWRRVALPRVIAGGDDESVPLMRERPMRSGRATAYVCERFACKEPAGDPATLAAQLS